MATTGAAIGKDITNVSVERRVQNELNDLRGRMSKLDRFIYSPGITEVNEVQDFLLRQQLKQMKNYETILSLRFIDIRNNTPKDE